MLESLPFSKPSGGSSHQQRSFEIDRKPVHVVRYIDYHILFSLEDLSFKKLCTELYDLDLAYSLDLDGLTAMKDEIHVEDLIIDGKGHRISLSRIHHIEIHVAGEVEQGWKVECTRSKRQVERLLALF